MVAARTEIALAQDRSNGHLEAVERAGHAQARATTDDADDPNIGGELRRDDIRARAQVEQVLQAAEDLGQDRHQRRGQLDRQRVPSRDRLDLDPALVGSDSGRPEVSLVGDLFDSGRGTCRRGTAKGRSRPTAAGKPA